MKRVMWLWLVLVLVLVVAPGCGTVTPPHVVDSQASFDGNVANSGFLRFDEFGNGIITGRALDRYNLLVVQYGDRFLPRLNKDDGVRKGAVEGGTQTYIIDKAHLVKFMTMNRWRKEGK